MKEINVRQSKVEAVREEGVDNERSDALMLIS